MYSRIKVTIFAWIVLCVLLAKFVLLIRHLLPGDVIAFGCIAILLLSGCLTTEEALSCFGTQSVVLIAVISILVSGMIHSGAINWFTCHVMGTPRSFVGSIIRLMIPVSLMSAFLSNTTLVAMFINVVKMWSKRLDIAPSRLLIPLSYAASIGGMCTIIGTPANLVISGYYEQQTGHSLSFFAPFIPGFISLIVCVISIILLRRLLPERKSPEESFESSADYTVELIVPAENKVVGMTVEEAGLLDVHGGHLVEIVRFDREIISPVPADEFILGNDHLVYSGQINSILELRSSHGLVNANKLVFNTTDLEKSRKLQMATVDISSPLIGTRMCDINFESLHNVVLVAVARDGERMTAIPREIALRAGDTLLLEGARLVPTNFVGNLNFFDNIALPQVDKTTFISMLLMFSMIILSALGVMPLIHSAILAALLMVITRCCSIEQLQQSINWKLIMSFAGSVCIGEAIKATGLAHQLSVGLQSVVGSSPLVILIILCVISTFITEFISNTTAAAILAPIAITLAMSLNVDPAVFCVAVMVNVNSSFATPMGSESNLMVYSPGGYRFSDFIRIGLPMNLILLVTNITVCYFLM